MGSNAARAGTTTPWFWGDRAEERCAYANDSAFDDGRRRLRPHAGRPRCSASTTLAARVASLEDVTLLPQKVRTHVLRRGSAEWRDVEIILSPVGQELPGALRGAAVKAVSPATRLGGGEHRPAGSPSRRSPVASPCWKPSTFCAATGDGATDRLPAAELAVEPAAARPVRSPPRGDGGAVPPARRPSAPATPGLKRSVWRRVSVAGQDLAKRLR